MTHKPSGVAAAHAAACDIGRGVGIAERLRKWAAVVPVPPAAETMQDAAEQIESMSGGGIAELVPLVRRLMKAIQYVPMRPVDCNQSEVYELMDRINVILDVPQE